MTASGVLVLLGAGASVEAGVPASVNLTRSVTEAVSSSLAWRLDQTTHALNVAIGAMTAHDTAMGGGAYDGIDVERLFSAVQMLSDRNSLEIAPFVSSWNSALDGFGPDRLPMNFKRKFAKELDSQFDTGFDRVFRDAVQAVAGKADSDAVFRRLQGRMIAALRGCLAIEEGESDYLAPLLNIGDRPLQVATLNYDRGVELMAHRWGRRVTTGVGLWDGRMSWDWEDGFDIHLLKLHGSLNWFMTHERGSEDRLSAQAIVVSNDLDDQRLVAGELGVVFGQRGKLRSDGPFLAMLHELERMLEGSDHLVIVGYSFRDDHINAIIRQKFNAAPLRISIIDPALSDLDTPWRYRDRQPFLSELLEVMTTHTVDDPEVRPRSPHQVIGQGAAAGLVELFGAAEERDVSAPAAGGAA
jgi:hypothetical protein